jgi:hypothetical protein
MQVAGNITGLMNQGPSQFTPQISDLQQQAFSGAKALTTSPLLQQSADVYNSLSPYTAQNVSAGTPISADQVQGQSLLDNLSSYYNPFKDQVLNPVMSDYDYQAGQTRAAQAAAAAQNKAFGGSRYGVQEAQTEDSLARGRAATEGGLLGQMYTQATGLSSEDAARRQAAMTSNQAANLQASQSNQQAALQAAIANQSAGQSAAALNQQGLLGKAAGLESVGAEQGADTRANLGVQAGLGGIQTDAENAIRQYPLEYQQQIEGLLGGLNPALYTGQTSTGNSTQTQTQNSGVLGGLGQLAGIASMFVKPVPISDRRAKVGIKTLYRDWKGRRWVEFRYRWAPAVRRVGVIAQELLRTDPQAVVWRPDVGYLAVDYGRLA